MHLPSALSNGIFQLSGWNPRTGGKKAFLHGSRMYIFQATRVKNVKIHVLG